MHTGRLMILVALAALGALAGGLYAQTARPDLAQERSAGASPEENPNTRVTAVWTGAISSLWNEAGNWNTNQIPTSSVDVLIPAGTSRKPITTVTTAYCRSLTLEGGSWITLSSSSLVVAQDANITGWLYINGNLNLDVNGDLHWNSGSAAQISHANAEIFCAGDMRFHPGSNVQMAMGTVELDGLSDSTLYNYSPNTRLFNLRSDVEGTYTFYLSGSEDFHINGNFYNYYGCRSVSTLAGTIHLRGDLNDYNATANRGVQWANGTLQTTGTDQSISLAGADAYLNHLTISSSGRVTLNSNLRLKGSYAIYDGRFDALNNRVTVEGDWTNYAQLSYLDGSSRVVFAGIGSQTVYGDESFHILEVANGGALRIDGGSYVACAVYDWTSGGIEISEPYAWFDARDLADNGIAGNWWLSADGTIELVNPAPNDNIGLKGNLFISGGNFAVYGGSADSYWPSEGSASISMSGGVLEFLNQGVYIVPSSSYGFSANINGGTIRSPKDFTVLRNDFQPSGGTIELVGLADASVSHFSGSWFHNVKINKGGAAYNRRGSDPDDGGNVTPLNNNGILTIMGNSLIMGQLNIAYASSVNANGNLTIDGTGDNSIANATLHLNGGTLISAGNLQVLAGGELLCEAGSEVRIGGGKGLFVGLSARLTLQGSASSPVTFRGRGAGYFGLEVLSGGTINAAYTNFHNLNGNGLKLSLGSWAEGNYALPNCVFSDGAFGGTLLWIDSEQNIMFANNSFPTHAGSNAKNVYKSRDAGHVRFSGWDGAFGGPGFENDPHNRIWWEGGGIPPVENLTLSRDPQSNLFMLNWDYPFSSASFVVERATTPDGPWFEAGSTTTHSWGHAVPGNSNFYRVTAVMP